MTRELIKQQLWAQTYAAQKEDNARNKGHYLDPKIAANAALSYFDEKFPEEKLPNVTQAELEKAEYIPVQLCPKCNGEGQVPSEGLSSVAFRLCPICNGAKTVMPFVVVGGGWSGDTSNIVQRDPDAKLRELREWMDSFHPEAQSNPETYVRYALIDKIDDLINRKP